MPKFEIRSTRPGADGATSECDVTWINGRLWPGERFAVYEAGHWLDAPILEVRGSGNDVTLVCELAVHFENQFAPAVSTRRRRHMPAGSSTRQPDIALGVTQGRGFAF